MAGIKAGSWLAALALVAMAPACFLFGPKRPQNLLVVAVDGLRQDALSTAIGAPRAPHLQRLAGSGVSFAVAHGHSAATLPAHAALLTGCSPAGNRVRIDGQAVEPSVELLQEVLRGAGWQTYAVFASPDVRAPAPGEGLDRGFHLVRSPGGAPSPATEVVTQAIRMIERASADAPRFAYVQFSDPTAPYAAHGGADRHAQILLDGSSLAHVGTSDPAEWRRSVRLPAGMHALELRSEEPFVVRDLCLSLGGEPLAWHAGGKRAGGPQAEFRAEFELAAEGEVELWAYVHDAPDVQEARRRYRREVEAVDAALGELIAHLERTGQYDTTTIAVVGPHGESLGEHELVGHDRSLFEEVLRVPIVIKPALGTDVLEELGRRQQQSVRVIDVAPTLLEIAGERRLRNAEGRSLLHDGLRPLVAEVHPPQAASTVVAMRDDRYKLVYTAAEDRFEMYEVRSDTLEINNVFTLQGHFRLKWQAQLRELAERAPHGADHRLGLAEPPARQP